MSELIIPRRKLLSGLVALIAAPTIVRAASIMPVKPIEADLLVKKFVWQLTVNVDQDDKGNWSVNGKPIALTEWKHADASALLIPA